MSTHKSGMLILLGILIFLGTACQLYQPDLVLTPTITEEVEDVQIDSTSTISSLSVPGYADFLEQVQESQRNERQGLVNLYSAKLESGPLINDDQVVFLYRGEGYKVQLVGDMNNWKVEAAPELSRVEGTDLWYYSELFEEDARLDYQFFVDDQSFILDQFNPNLSAGATGPNSSLIMPNFRTPPELLASTKEIPTGTLTTHTIDSQHLNQTRTFFVYEPPGQIVGEQLPSVYINDGSDYLNIIDAPSILDRLIANRLIPPIVAIFIPPIDRKFEYHGNDSYVRFLADELAPFIRATYATNPNPESTAILGSSLGGNAALFAAQKRSDTFGLVGSISAIIEESVDPLINAYSQDSRGLQAEGQLPNQIRPYMVVGSYETDVEIDGTRRNIISGNRALAQVLRDGGYNLVYEERSEGHSWGMWQVALGRALDNLFNR
jgi:enterochelin esterase family protein